jgi:hypothetical protein
MGTTRGEKGKLNVGLLVFLLSFVGDAHSSE